MIFTWCTQGGEEMELAARVEAAFDAWFALVPCVELTHENVGACDTAEDADFAFMWADPNDEIAEGVVAAIYYNLEETTIVRTDLVFNDMAFTTDAAIAAGECTDEPNLDLLLLHNVGELLGLPESCEEGVPCTDAEAQAAVMNWTAAVCESRALNAYDAALMQAAYAPVTSPYPPGEPGFVLAAPPFQVCASLVENGPEAAGATVTWSFGDGGTGAGLAACHTYTEVGSFTITAEVAYASCDSIDTITYANVSSVEVPEERTDLEADTCGCATPRPVGAWGALIGVLAALGLRRRG